MSSYSSFCPSPISSLPPLPTMPYTPGKDITKQAIRDLQAVFKIFDLNNDGTIDRREFADIIEILGDERPNSTQLEQCMRAVCGAEAQEPVPAALNIRQFLNFFVLSKADDKTHVPEADLFRVLDRDGNGMVSSRDLMRTLHGFDMKINQEEADAMADVASLTTGTIEFGKNEFHDLVRRIERYDNSASLSFDES